MKTIITAGKLVLVMTLITGLAYPLFVSVIAKILFADKAEGSPILKNGIVIGSELIGQNFTGQQYFWPRPSAIEYNPLPSGGSNLGPTSAVLKDKIAGRRARLLAIYGRDREIPDDLLFSSASGLDPHVSPQAARYQVDRIIKARHLDQTTKNSLYNLIDKYTEYPTLGLLGEPRVNVLKLNLALDSLAGGSK
ncbi:MAG: potassium-transporting ATPase subunit KdpC [candidate division Zixibacteria bacterium]|nr:potassium-transporting ATPase subunit KdpC [candidate division Zixibacteria bacterium]